MPSVLTAIATPTRQRMLRLVWDRERSAGEIASAFSVTFSAVSQHLRILRDAGVVTRRRKGKSLLYKADIGALGAFAPALEAMWSDRLDDLKRLAEREERATERLEAKSGRRVANVRRRPRRKAD